tara:strand:+ start:84 stop:215 length:132 start_codon:yes stop_codon:yes gene_type:complete
MLEKYKDQLAQQECKEQLANADHKVSLAQQERLVFKDYEEFKE